LSVVPISVLFNFLHMIPGFATCRKANVDGLVNNIFDFYVLEIGYVSYFLGPFQTNLSRLIYEVKSTIISRSHDTDIESLLLKNCDRNRNFFIQGINFSIDHFRRQSNVYIGT